MDKQLWAATAIIIAGYVLGFYFQNRRLDDFKQAVDNRFGDLRGEMNHRFDDLKDWIRAELRRIDGRIDSVLKG